MGVLEDITKNISFCHQIEKDSYRLLEYHGCKEVAEHCIRVAAEAEKLANRFNADRTSARLTGFLHDTGRVFPDKQSISIACELGIQVLDEERVCAGLLHQKISRAIASELFGIKNNIILSAIECHTTLKAGASDIDLILFIADKLSWDSSDSRPILDGILKGLEQSLESGAFYYINYICENRDNVKVLHPWALEAYVDLKERCAKV